MDGPRAPGDQTYGGVPGADIPADTGALSGPAPAAAQGTLAFDLTSVVDDCRALAADLGVRPYRAFLVHVQWSGGRRGEGTAVITSRREIVPPPRVRDPSSVRQVVESTGRTEEGDLFVDRISARYTEDDLLGRTPDLQDPALQRTSSRAADFYWELQEVRASVPPPPVRRYRPSSVPALSRAGQEWRVNLSKTDYDPGRLGGQGPRDFY